MVISNAGPVLQCGYRPVRQVLAVAVLALVLAAALPARAQEGPYTVVVQVDSSALPQVTLYVSVSDAAGAPVTDLEQQDFSVTEAGQPVAINDFAGLGASRPVDIVFVFDTTGSMLDELDGVKRTCVRFANELASRGRDYRLGLVTFWDDVREVFNPDGTLTDDVNGFRGWIDEIETFPGAGSGDNENDYGALKQAAQMRFREEAQVIFILITDAPAHVYGDPPDGGVSFDDPDLTLERITDILTRRGITVYAVAPEQFEEYPSLAEQTGGRFYDIEAEKDFTDIIDTIGAVIATQYRIGFQTTRPHPDGTVRDVVVTVQRAAGGAGGTGSAEYLEQHLVNIRSHPWVGLALLLPLLVLLAVPVPIRLLFRRVLSTAPVSAPETPTPYPQAVSPPAVSHPPTASWPAPPPTVATCPYCHWPLRPGARFCGRCGQKVLVEELVCSLCGNRLKPGARFCSRCGRPVGSR